MSFKGWFASHDITTRNLALRRFATTAGSLARSLNNASVMNRTSIPSAPLVISVSRVWGVGGGGGGLEEETAVVGESGLDSAPPPHSPLPTPSAAATPR